MYVKNSELSCTFKSSAFILPEHMNKTEEKEIRSCNLDLLLEVIGNFY